MTIGSIGYGHDHDSSFVMDRPDGPGAGLFLLIRSEALFDIDGRQFTAKENSFVVITPETPCRYRALKDIYMDDWFYFSGNDEDIELLKSLGIPLNTIVCLGNIEELSLLMHMMTHEHYSAEKYHEQAEQHYLGLLLLKLSRKLMDVSQPSSAAFSKHNTVFTHIRTRIYSEPAKIGSIDELAREASLSRSGFQHAYKKLYGVSIKTDILNGRIGFAKRLLSSTRLTVGEIALQCGYSTPFSFMKQFKVSCGQTPTEYRRGKK